MSGMQLAFDLGKDLGRSPSPPAAPEDEGDVFITLRPDDAAREQSMGIANEFLARLRVAEAVRPLHVTIQGLGKRATFSPTFIAEKIEALSALRFEPFTITLDEIMSFRRKEGKLPLVLHAGRRENALFDLHRKIIAAQAQPGIMLAAAPAFKPHMTLFYSHKVVPAQPLGSPVRWLVRQFSIVWSDTGNCRHEVLWEWPPLD